MTTCSSDENACSMRNDFRRELYYIFAAIGISNGSGDKDEKKETRTEL